MTARWIVPPFDVAEDRHPGLGLRCKPSLCEQLAFQGREEALAHGVIVRIADGSHGRSYAGLATTAAEGQSRILAALVAVVNDIVRLRWPIAISSAASTSSVLRCVSIDQPTI